MDTVKNPSTHIVSVHLTQRKEGKREETEDLDNVRNTFTVSFAAVYYCTVSCVLQEFRLSDLDDLEKVLDNALIRFETTTL